VTRSRTRRLARRVDVRHSGNARPFDTCAPAAHGWQCLRRRSIGMEQAAAPQLARPYRPRREGKRGVWRPCARQLQARVSLRLKERHHIDHYIHATFFVRLACISLPVCSEHLRREASAAAIPVHTHGTGVSSMVDCAYVRRCGVGRHVGYDVAAVAGCGRRGA
jgi:hypothetical protein